jgi:transcriptional regulator with XRE-family HTH domain
MIRTEVEYRNSTKRIEELEAELNGMREPEADEAQAGVAEALRNQIEEIKEQIEEYEALKEGGSPVLRASSFEGMGKLLIRFRISLGWSQSDLANALGMEPQQIQRYERNDWQKASLWRLQEVAEAMGIQLRSKVKIRNDEISLWKLSEEPSEELNVADTVYLTALFGEKHPSLESWLENTGSTRVAASWDWRKKVLQSTFDHFSKDIARSIEPVSDVNVRFWDKLAHRNLRLYTGLAHAATANYFAVFHSMESFTQDFDDVVTHGRKAV